jgi:hypothetical protein
VGHRLVRATILICGLFLVGCAEPAERLADCLVVSGWQASPTMIQDPTGEWCEQK